MNDAILIVLPLTLMAVVLMVIIVRALLYQRNPIRRATMEKLRNSYKGKQDAKVFLCYSAEDTGGGIIQLWGESVGTALRPGMKIIGPTGATHIIKEVYAQDDTPETPDQEVAEGVPDTPITIDAAGWDWKLYQQRLKQEIVLSLKLM